MVSLYVGKDVPRLLAAAVVVVALLPACSGGALVTAGSGMSGAGTGSSASGSASGASGAPGSGSSGSTTAGVASGATAGSASGAASGSSASGSSGASSGTTSSGSSSGSIGGTGTAASGTAASSGGADGGGAPDASLVCFQDGGALVHQAKACYAADSECTVLIVTTCCGANLAVGLSKTQPQYAACFPQAGPNSCLGLGCAKFFGTLTDDGQPGTSEPVAHCVVGSGGGRCMTRHASLDSGAGGG
jgi:hypothetical protein